VQEVISLKELLDRLMGQEDTTDLVVSVFDCRNHPDSVSLCLGRVS